MNMIVLKRADNQPFFAVPVDKLDGVLLDGDAIVVKYGGFASFRYTPGDAPKVFRAILEAVKAGGMGVKDV